MFPLTSETDSKAPNQMAYTTERKIHINQSIDMYAANQKQLSTVDPSIVSFHIYT